MAAVIHTQASADQVNAKQSPTQPAHVIRTGQEALDVAAALAKVFEQGAAERDRTRGLPWDELALLSSSGLSAITVPAAYGGADVSIAVLVEVFAVLAAVDPSLTQIPQNHFAILERLRNYGSAEQKAFFYPHILAGDRLGNATAEPGDKTPSQYATRLARDPAGDGYRITGKKKYATGALFAQWIPVSAIDEDGRSWVLYVPHDAAGVTIVDNWDGFGQRTTASGAVIFDDTPVAAIGAFPSAAQVSGLDTTSSISQLLHVAIDLGIARRATEDTIHLLKTSANPPRGSGAARAVEDPLTVREVGDLKLRLNVAESMTARAARLTDLARQSGAQADVGAAMIAVAEAKILSTDLALHASSKLFELVGTHSTARSLNLDRHWRNARTHTLHDSARWKYHAIGNYYLNDLLADPWSFAHPYRPRPV